MAYIYQIQNDINNKLYIGKTEHPIEKRFREHCKDAYRNRCEKRPLYAAMRKYGVEHFHISLLEETNNPEEREVYWIEKLGTFKNGYNATIGGDGKHYLDYDLIIKTYKKLQNQKAVAKELNICQDTVSDVLKRYHINILSSKEVSKRLTSKKVGMYDLQENLLKEFFSAHDASRYLFENKMIKGQAETARKQICNNCNGITRSYIGFKWKYLDK